MLPPVLGCVVPAVFSYAPGPAFYVIRVEELHGIEREQLRRLTLFLLRRGIMGYNQGVKMVCVSVEVRSSTER